MAKITRFTGNLKAFGSSATGTERTVFGDVSQSDTLDANITAKFLSGWEEGLDAVSGFPPQQFFNAVSFTATQLTAYLHQMGIAEWDSLQEYPEHGLTQKAGITYRSLVDANIGNDPISDAVNWFNVNQAIGILFDDSNVPFTAANVQESVEALFDNVVNATPIVITEGQDWDGVTYIDPGAIGANPTAKIYPDGTIIGSTDNGEYFKLPSGVLICLMSVSINLTVTQPNLFGTTSGTMYSGTSVETFPHVFIGAPEMSTSPTNSSNAGYSKVRSPGAASFTASMANIASGNLGAGYIAIGRWK